MKKITVILILFLISSIIGISGCTSPNNTHYNSSTTMQKAPNSTSTYDASGYCNYVVDGDTIDVQGVGRIRFVGVNTPERGQVGYQEAKDYVKSLCLGKIVNLDIDNAKYYDKYGRTLAVVYAGNTNVNAELLKRGYAEIMYIPPSQFNPYSWVGNTNYKTVSKSTSSNKNSVSSKYYIGNLDSKKFHRPDCPSVYLMDENNKIRLNSRQEALNLGYTPCKNCNP